MRQVVLIAHNIRSAHNIGSLMRTAEGLGVEKMYITGYSPYPSVAGDTRLPHIARKVSARIEKTSLGAQASLDWEYSAEIWPVIAKLKEQGYLIAALEQTADSIDLSSFDPPDKIGLIAGSETRGLDDDVINACYATLQIPMAGKKESFNVAVAVGIALYHLIAA